MAKNLAHKYVALVKKEIPFSSKSKRKFLYILEQNIENYTRENPAVSFSDLEASFGSPKEVASSYYDTLDKEDFDKHLKTKRTILFLVLSVCLFIIFACACYYYNLHKDLPAYTIEEIRIIE